MESAQSYLLLRRLVKLIELAVISSLAKKQNYHYPQLIGPVQGILVQDCMMLFINSIGVLVPAATDLQNYFFTDGIIEFVYD